MVIDTNEVSSKAMGGTELMALGLSERLKKIVGLPGKSRYDDFQIVCSRVRDLDESKFRIFWAHDLPGDPESEFLHDPQLRDRFHRFVFVSNWQLWGYAQRYNLPMERCVVIPNAITPIHKHEKPDPDKRINLIYFSTPHRGLELLKPVYDLLYQQYGDKIHLDVYSSFNLYGWGERDAPYQSLFDSMEGHPGITNHGAQPNSVIRAALEKAHILAYPSIWPETSCLVLIEAMSAGLVCVHSNLAALPETSAGLTKQYTFHPDPSVHANKFHQELSWAIKNYEGPCTYSSRHAKLVHEWGTVLDKWEDLLEEVKTLDPPKAFPRGEVFSIKVP